MLESSQKMIRSNMLLQNGIYQNLNNEVFLLVILTGVRHILKNDEAVAT
jgi:hypothetical protein